MSFAMNLGAASGILEAYQQSPDPKFLGFFPEV